MSQTTSSYPVVTKDTLLTISKKNITPFPGLPSLLEVASEIFSKDPIKPENYQRFNAISDPNDVFIASYGATTTTRPQKTVQKKRYVVPKSPFTASGQAQDVKEKVWYYIDENDNTQGPFSSSEMDGWFDDGFFVNDLLIRFKDQGEFKKLYEALGKPEYQPQTFTNTSTSKPFSFARNDSDSNKPYNKQEKPRQFNVEPSAAAQQGAKDKFERRTEEKPAAQEKLFVRAKKEDVPESSSPVEGQKQQESPVKEPESKPEPKQEAPVEVSSPVQENEPETKEEPQQEEEPQRVEEKKPQANPPVDFDDSEWVSIKKTKNKKKGAKGKEQPSKPEPPKVVKAPVITAQKPMEEKADKSPKKAEPEPTKAEPPKVEESNVKPQEEEKAVVQEKATEAKATEVKPEAPKLGVSYPFKQDIAPIVMTSKQKSKGKKKIIANWADEDSEVTTISREQERPTENLLSSVVDFPSLGGPIMTAKVEAPKATGSKNKGNKDKEDQQLKQDLLQIQQQQQREEEEKKLQQRIKQEEEREKKLKQQQKQKEEQLVAETKPIKKEVPAVTEEEFPSLGMGAQPQPQKAAPKKKPQNQPKVAEKPAPAPKEKASPVKTNNPKYLEDFPTL